MKQKNEYHYDWEDALTGLRYTAGLAVAGTALTLGGYCEDEKLAMAGGLALLVLSPLGYVLNKKFVNKVNEEHNRKLKE